MDNTHSAALETASRYLTPAQAARHFPSRRTDGKGVHPSAVIRYLTIGVSLKSGDRLKLAGLRHPGGWVTSADAIQQFVESLTADRCGEPVSIAPPRLPAARQRAIAQAERELAAAGI